jgi:hypothetical protein
VFGISIVTCAVLVVRSRPFSTTFAFFSPHHLIVTLQEFCAHKATDAAAAGAQDDSETWTFMGVLFEEDARRQLLAKLGFADALSAAAAAAGSGSGDAAGGLAGSSSVDVAGQQLHSAMEQLGLGEGGSLRSADGVAQNV